MNCVPCPHRANEAKRVLRHPYEYVNWFDILFPNEQCVPENVAIERGPDCTNIVHLVNFENIMCFFERGYTHKNFNSFLFCIELFFLYCGMIAHCKSRLSRSHTKIEQYFPNYFFKTLKLKIDKYYF